MYKRQDQQDGGPVEAGDEEEEDRRDAVDERGEDVLEGVEALEVVGEQQAHQGEVDDALGCAEVATVDAGEHQAEEQQGAAVAGRGGVVAGAPGAEGGGELRLEHHEDQGDGDQYRDDRVERGGGQRQQENRAAQAADEAGGAEAEDAGALAAQFAAVAESAAEGTGHQAERVGDVRRDRRQAEGQQYREGEEGAGANDGVDGAGADSRGEDCDAFPEGHAISSHAQWSPPRHQGRGATIDHASGAPGCQSIGGVSRFGVLGLGMEPPPVGGAKLPRAPPRPLSASPISLGTIQSLLASPSAIFGSIWRYW